MFYLRNRHTQTDNPVAEPLRMMLALLLLAAGGIAGCSNSIEPIDRRDGFYSIYGALDLHSEVNYIRVKDLNAPMRADSTRKLDATVTLKNMNTGREEVLEDSLVQFEGVYTHNFRTGMDIRPGQTYRVTTKGPDGAEARATTTAPEFAEWQINPTTPDCTTLTRISFRPVKHPHDLTASVAFEYKGDRYWSHGWPDQAGDENETVMPFVPRNLIMDVFENLDTEAPWCHQLSSEKFWVKFTHYSPEFFGQIDTDTLDLPGGAGRFGALYEESFSFPIDTTNVCFPLCDPVAGSPTEE